MIAIFMHVPVCTIGGYELGERTLNLALVRRFDTREAIQSALANIKGATPPRLTVLVYDSEDVVYSTQPVSWFEYVIDAAIKAGRQ